MSRIYFPISGGVSIISTIAAHHRPCVSTHPATLRFKCALRRYLLYTPCILVVQPNRVKYRTWIWPTDYEFYFALLLLLLFMEKSDRESLIIYTYDLNEFKTNENKKKEAWIQYIFVPSFDDDKIFELIQRISRSSVCIIVQFKVANN